MGMLEKNFLVIFLLSCCLLVSCQSPTDTPNQQKTPSPNTEILLPSKLVITKTPEKIQTLTPEPKQTTLTPTVPLLKSKETDKDEAIQNTLTSQQDFSILTQDIENVITRFGGRWHIIIKEIDGPTYLKILPDQRINIASIVKVPIGVLFFETLSERGILENETKEYIDHFGTGGRTFDQLLYAMLVKSEEDATNILNEYIHTNMNIPAKKRGWGIQGIDLEARRSTAAEIASFLEDFYLGNFVTPTAQKIILSYLEEYTPNDETRLGSLQGRLPEQYKIFNKRGSLLTPYVVADVAIIENLNGTDFVLALFAYNAEPKTTYEALDQAIGEMALIIWDFISKRQ
jgi:beta-lactamase class A